jgi:exopolyphosphatase/guanosine-5'-triphosphate,3'-diphosphate pyrophosphatase
MKERIAIIDLGTNTFHLLIADGAGKILHTEKKAVKIGKNGINKRVIPADGFERALSCLRDFKVTMLAFDVGTTRAFGTSALRNAVNAPQLIEEVKKDTGIDIEVISGDQEAEYIYYGVRWAVKLGADRSLIVDIGGGSVEFIIADDGKIFWKQSIEIGAQRLLEAYQKHDPILPEEVKQLEHHFDHSLSGLKKAVEEFKPTILVGSSGTFDTLSEIYCIDHNIDIARELPATPLTVPYFFKIHASLISNDRAGRMKIRGMIDMRADMIVVASCLVNYLITKFRLEQIKVSSYSLKEGVLAQITAIRTKP